MSDVDLLDTEELSWLDARAIASELTGERRTDQLDWLTQSLLNQGDDE